MIQRRVNDLLIFQFQNLRRYPGVVHGVPGRHADPSRFPRGLDLSFVTSPTEEYAVAARRELCSALGISIEHIVAPRQVHGHQVVAVGAGDRGKGALARETGIADTDGLVTNVPSTALFITAADCVPLLFFDPVQRAIGIAHAGWRGTADRIGSVAVDHLRQVYGCRPTDLMAAIGPAIGPCCYTVGPDVVAEVERSYGSLATSLVAEDRGRQMLDLWRANKVDLIAAGLREENIEVAGLCTSCRNDVFFSHRAEQGRAGRFGAIITLTQSGR